MSESNYVEVQYDAEGNIVNPDYDSDDDEMSEDEDEGPFGDEVSFTSGVNARGESVAIPDRSHFPDGSRTWMYSPAAKPSDWPADYVDENIERVMTLGWVVPNEQGNHWTDAEAEQINAEYIEQMTAPYRMDESAIAEMDDSTFDPYRQPAYDQQPQGGYDQQPQDAYAQEPAYQGAVPEAPPRPDAGWERPNDPNAAGTNYGDVMNELRERNPENDGLWTAERAAGVSGDTQYTEESGINAADQRAYLASQAAYGPDGTLLSGDALIAANEAASDAARTRIDAEAAPNRYQQTTGRDPAQSDAQRQSLDESAASLREQVANDPGSFGIGLSPDVQDYMARSGQTLEPGSVLNAEQQAWLDQVRAAEMAEGQRQSDAFYASPEGQQAQRDADAAQARAAATEQRFQESQARAEGRQ